mgnify:CR=1 FL=1
MKLTPLQLQKIVSKVFETWKEHKVIEFKEDEKKAFARAVTSLQAEIQKEVDLEREVNNMLEDLERKHGGEFQRHKMFPMLKQKLAKEKKVIL